MDEKESEWNLAMHRYCQPAGNVRFIKRIANKARINRPVSPHVLRHTFAVAAVQKGISLPALQRLLGHDRLTTTEIYLNLSPEDVIREFKEKW